jgi:hypothetical protein
MRGRRAGDDSARRDGAKKSAGHATRVTPLAAVPRSGSPPLPGATVVNVPARDIRTGSGPPTHRLAYAGAVPLTLRLILGAVLVAVGAALVVTAVLGARSRLRRNRWVGIRTAATLATEAAFAAGNRAGAVPAAAAGAVALMGGATLLGGAGGVLGWIVLGISVIGTGVLAGVGGLVGDRAAAGVAPTSPFSAACAGTCAGCDLVAGCRPELTGEQLAAPAE